MSFYIALCFFYISSERFLDSYKELWIALLLKHSKQMYFLYLSVTIYE